MFKGMTHLHITSVMVFLIIYLIKTVLLLANANETLEKFKAKTKVLEMIVSTAFLGTGIYMLFNIPEIKPMLVIKIGIVFASIPIAIIAYRKNNKGLAVLSLVMIIASYGLAEMSKKHNGQPISLPGDAVNNLTDEEFAEKFGKDLYTLECYKCHGTDGKLGLSGAKDLSTSALSQEECITIITNGKGAMPIYKDIYNDRQIKAVATYIQSFKN
jgi:uncharacterized membrane protein SirB2